MAATFESLMAVDRDLVAKGHHPITPWWREQAERFYRHPSARSLVARVGRGGTKSHFSTKLSLNEVLYGDWNVPPGEVHYWGYASTDKPEAAQRLLLIERFLMDLGVPYGRAGDEIVLREMPRGWRVFAAQIGAVSGFRCFGFSCDELAKWRAADKFSNPAVEVVASLNAMTVTHPGARKALISSAFGMSDYHCKRFAQGDTADQVTCEAPTWVANPSITEEETHRLEPNLRIWKREYPAIPQAGALGAFEPEAIARAFVPLSSAPRPTQMVGIIDPASGKKDCYSWGTCGWCDVDGVRKLVFTRVDGIGGAFWSKISGDTIVESIANAFKEVGVLRVHSDQRESLMTGAAFRRNGLAFIEHPWTAPSKERAVATVRRWFADSMIILPEHEKMRDELLSFEERITASGNFTFGARGGDGGADDFVSLLLTAAMADAVGGVPGSPSRVNDMFAALTKSRAGALLVSGDTRYMQEQRELLGELQRRGLWR